MSTRRSASQASSRVAASSASAYRSSAPSAPLGQVGGGQVQGVQGRVGGPERVGGQRADGFAGAGVEGLARETEGARPVHGAAFGREETGEHMQQRGLATAVLADDGRPGARGDGDGHAPEDLPCATRDGDVIGAQMGTVADRGRGGELG